MRSGESQPDDRLLTDEESAAICGQSARTIRRWRTIGTRESGTLPYCRINGRVRIRKSDLEAFIEGHRVEPAAEVPPADLRRRPQSPLRSDLQQFSDAFLANHRGSG